MPRIKTPANAVREMTERRTARGKTFDLGGKKRKLVLGKKLLHYRDGGEWRNIETTIVKEQGEWKCDTLPYRFVLHKDGIGFDFEGRDGGTVSNKLVAVGGEPFRKAVQPQVDGDTITFTEVAQDMDIIVKVLPGKVKTLRILKSAQAPRSFTWKVTTDEKGAGFVSDRLIGHDNYGATKRQDRRELHLMLEKSGEIYTETWTGQTKVRDPQTRQKSLSNDVTYPVEIDPTINKEAAPDAYDGYEKKNPTSHWYYAYDYVCLGYYTGLTAAYHPGWRFSSVPLPSGVTIDSAILSLNVTGKRHGAYGGGKIYAVEVADFNPGFAEGGNLPTTVSKTTAFTTIARPTTTGVVQYDVKAVLEELMGVFSENGDMGFFALTYETTDRVTYFEDFGAVGTDNAKLDIEYTEGGGGGGTSNLLLLGVG